MASNRWETGIGEIGALLSVAYAERKTLEEGSSTGRWETPAIDQQLVDLVPVRGAGLQPAGRTGPDAARRSRVAARQPMVTTCAAAGTANNLSAPAHPALRPPAAMIRSAWA